MKPVLRTVGLFLAFALPATILDDWLTELARRSGNYVELNPAGFLPLHEVITREAVLMLIAVGLVGVGAFFRREALANAPHRSLDEFGSDLFSRHAWAVALIWIPVLGEAFRYVTVVSNFCYLTIHWSPIDSVTLNPLQSLFGDDAKGYVAHIVIMMMLLWNPMAALTVRALHAVHRRAVPQGGV